VDATFGLTRRALIGAGGIGALMLGGCDRFLREPWSFKQFFSFELKLQVDGRPYTIKNGGLLALGGLSSGYHMLPLPGVARLPSGECLVAFPPPIEDTVAEQVKRRGPTAVEQPYRPDGTPAVLIFDSAERPARVEAYAMPAAMHADDLRVKLISAEIRFEDEDPHQSIAETFPWFAKAEEIYRIYVDHGYLGRERIDALLSANPALFYTRGNDLARHDLRPGLYAFQAALRWADLSVEEKAKAQGEIAAGFTGKYSDLGQALARGEEAEVPLQSTGTLDDPSLKWAGDPRVFVFRALTEDEFAWATAIPNPARVIRTMPRDASQTYLTQMLRFFDATPLGPLTFPDGCGRCGDFASTDGLIRVRTSYTRVSPLRLASGDERRWAKGAHRLHV